VNAGRFDVVGGVEIRLAGAQADDVLPGAFQLGGFGGNDQGQGGFDSINTIGQSGHKFSSHSSWWTVPYEPEAERIRHCWAILFQIPKIPMGFGFVLLGTQVKCYGHFTTNSAFF
jgi:hypothetical protein